ncbi:MAG: hypothetical protein JWN93_2675 [Hyphomicrobiales bacterium]|nr:hypothetical protein [Hyphomicrobiales bacterium]
MLAGCATVTRGTTSQVQIVSEPSGASARTSLGQQCTTPCTLQMSRKDEFTVVYSMPGYEDAQVDVKTQVAGAGAAGFAGNVILGGVIGMGVDAATGATYEHVPNPVTMTLRPIPAARAPAPAHRGKPAPRARKPSPVAAPSA